MQEQLTRYRWTAAFAAGAMSLASVAPMAYADHGHGKGRWKHDHETVVVHDHGSSALPVLAGAVGGFVLGTAVANAGHSERVVYRDRVIHDDDGYYRDDGPGYYRSSKYYYDPYCGERFYSLSAAKPHLLHSGHPMVMLAIDARSGDCVAEYRYDGDRWCDYHGDWRDAGRYREGYYSRGRDRDDDRCSDRYSRDDRYYRGDRDDDNHHDRGYDRD